MPSSLLFEIENGCYQVMVVKAFTVALIYYWYGYFGELHSGIMWT